MIKDSQSSMPNHISNKNLEDHQKNLNIEDDFIPNIEISLKITDISELSNPFVQYNNCLISK